MKLVELKTAQDFRIYGNLSRTTPSQIRRRVGPFTWVAILPDQTAGTVRDTRGKCWDWHRNDEGDVSVYPSA